MIHVHALLLHKADFYLNEAQLKLLKNLLYCRNKLTLIVCLKLHFCIFLPKKLANIVHQTFSKGYKIKSVRFFVSVSDTMSWFIYWNVNLVWSSVVRLALYIFFVSWFFFDTLIYINFWNPNHKFSMLINKPVILSTYVHIL